MELTWKLQAQRQILNVLLLQETQTETSKNAPGADGTWFTHTFNKSFPYGQHTLHAILSRGHKLTFIDQFQWGRHWSINSLNHLHNYLICPFLLMGRWGRDTMRALTPCQSHTAGQWQSLTLKPGDSASRSRLKSLVSINCISLPFYKKTWKRK